MYRLLIPAILICILGCQRRETTDVSPFHQEPCEYVLLIAVDCNYVKHNSKVYDFVLQAIEEYFRARIGNHDQLIIVQLSGTNRPLLWQGTPQQLRQEFPDNITFRDYILAHADKGSRINDGISEALNYLMQTYSVAHGNAKPVALILSDMVDDQPGQGESDPRLMNALTTYARRGHLGFYFCDQTRMADIRQKMEQAGFRMFTLECDIHGRPPLPSFE